jgi:hypothetical protein
LADGNGRLVNIEGSPGRVVVEEADGQLARVMYGSRELAGGKLHARCQLMYDLLRETQGKNNLTRLQDYFADTKYKIHVGKGTIDMMVFDTTARTAHLSRGTSYNASWREFRFGASYAHDAGERDDAQARAIIDKAIQAHGAADKLSQFKAVSAKWSGKHRIENEHYGDAVRVVTYEMPDKIRFDFEVENPKGNNFSFSRVVNGKKGWQGSDRRTRDLNEAEVTQIVDELYAHWLASVVPFQDVVPLKDKGFEFSVFGNVPADGKDAVGVVVSCKGRPDVILFFDKETGLVIKRERRAKDPVTNREYTAESIYRDYKAFQGVMWPTSRIDRRDGMDLEEDSGRFELGEFQALDKLEETSLAKP